MTIQILQRCAWIPVGIQITPGPAHHNAVTPRALCCVITGKTLALPRPRKTVGNLSNRVARDVYEELARTRVHPWLRNSPSSPSSQSQLLLYRTRLPRRSRTTRMDVHRSRDYLVAIILRLHRRLINRQSSSSALMAKPWVEHTMCTYRANTSLARPFP